MAKKKPKAASASPQAEPVHRMISFPGGERMELLIPAEAKEAFLQVAPVYNRHDEADVAVFDARRAGGVR